MCGECLYSHLSNYTVCISTQEHPWITKSGRVLISSEENCGTPIEVDDEEVKDAVTKSSYPIHILVSLDTLPVQRFDGCQEMRNVQFCYSGDFFSHTSQNRYLFFNVLVTISSLVTIL